VLLLQQPLVPPRPRPLLLLLLLPAGSSEGLWDEQKKGRHSCGLLPGLHTLPGPDGFHPRAGPWSSSSSRPPGWVPPGAAVAAADLGSSYRAYGAAGHGCIEHHLSRDPRVAAGLCMAPGRRCSWCIGCCCGYQDSEASPAAAAAASARYLMSAAGLVGAGSAAAETAAQDVAGVAVSLIRCEQLALQVLQAFSSSSSRAAGGSRLAGQLWAADCCRCLPVAAAGVSSPWWHGPWMWPGCWQQQCRFRGMALQSTPPLSPGA